MQVLYKTLKNTSTNVSVSVSQKSNNTNAENESQPILNKLKTNANKRPQSCGKQPSRSTSKTRQEPSTGKSKLKI